MNGQVMVSVVCVVYNHGKYIRDALDGFVGQITNFPFEILIHDDASTDGSADIIREYVDKYPDLFVPIFQTENQYSKGVKIGDVLLYPRCKGKYIALCEGDDYWIDPYKLQKQFDALERNPEIDMCSNGANIVDAKSGNIIGAICPKNRECIITAQEVIIGGGEYFATNSLFCRKEVLTVIPPFRNKIAIDYTVQINGSLRGGVYYIPDIMSVYRKDVPGSWTMRNSNKESSVRIREQLIEMLIVLDDYTNRSYREAIDKAIRNNRFAIHRIRDQESLLLTSEYSECRKRLKGVEKIRFFFKALFPKATRIIKTKMHLG